MFSALFHIITDSHFQAHAGAHDLFAPIVYQVNILLYAGGVFRTEFFLWSTCLRQGLQEHFVNKCHSAIELLSQLAGIVLNSLFYAALSFQPS